MANPSSSSPQRSVKLYGQPNLPWTLNREPFYLETSVPGSFAAGDVRCCEAGGFCGG